MDYKFKNIYWFIWSEMKITCPLQINRNNILFVKELTLKTKKNLEKSESGIVLYFCRSH